MSNHYGNRSYGGDSYAGGVGRGGRGHHQRENHYGRAGERHGGGSGRSHSDQRGAGGRGGGHFWSGQRRTLEKEGITVKTNCFQLTPKNLDKTITAMHQYVVRIDTLVKERDSGISNDSMYAPAVGEQLPDSATAASVAKPFYLVKKKEISNPDDDRSTILSRRVLNHCQLKLQEVPPYQSFVSFLVHCVYLPLVHVSWILFRSLMFLISSMMVPVLHILEIN